MWQQHDTVTPILASDPPFRRSADQVGILHGNMQPLVSILIPAYNAQATVAAAIQSALAQTWARKEIIVVDDGSTDLTAEIAARFVPKIKLISTGNQGLSAAVNLAIRLSQGDYIQELDADDQLAPDKIEKQLAALRPGDSKKLLLSSPWAPFFFRTQHARFINNSLCQDLSPADWLVRKMSENLHMQNATWLMSRELVEAAGPWDADLKYDQDGEYFARVISLSDGTRFVPGTGIYYRISGTGSISYIGASAEKRNSLFRSMKSHVQYLRSLEDTPRVREACLKYLQNWYGVFYPDREDLARELQEMAADLGGLLKQPKLRWKFAWMKYVIGLQAAKRAQMGFPHLKTSILRGIDRTIYRLESKKNIQNSFDQAQ